MVKGFVEVIAPRVVIGWAVAPPGARRPMIRVFDRGGHVVGEGVADQYRSDLEEVLGTDGAHVFFAILAPSLAEEALDGITVRAIAEDGSEHDVPVLADAWVKPHHLRGQRRIPQAILHIGAEKTGTSSLQRFMQQRREALAERGTFVPTSLAPATEARLLNHIHVTTAALRPRTLDDGLRAGLGLRDEAEIMRHRRDVIGALVTEVRDAGPERFQRMLVSNEHAFSRLRHRDELVFLRNMLLQVADQVKIVVYLRAQHELAMSLYSTALRNGWARYSPFDLVEDVGEAGAFIDHAFFDFATLLEAWADVFGETSVEVRLFEPATLPGRDVIPDFFASQGMDIAGIAPVDGQENQGLTVLSARFLLAANQLPSFLSGDERALQREEQERLIRSIEQQPTRALRPSRTAAKDFFERFAAENERVRRRWFPARTRLFDVDWAGMPETGDDPCLRPEDGVWLFNALTGMHPSATIDPIGGLPPR